MRGLEGQCCDWGEGSEWCEWGGWVDWVDGESGVRGWDSFIEKKPKIS